MKVEIKELSLSQIKSNPNNPRLVKDHKYKKLLNSLKEFPEMKEIREIVIDENNVILGGNMRFKALKELGEKKVTVKQVKGLTDKQKQRFVVSDNKNYGIWDHDILANEYELDDLLNWGFEESELDLRERIREDINYDYEQTEEPEQAKTKIYKADIPIAIILSKNDFQRWEHYKKEVKIKDDTKAFLEMLNGF